MRSMNFGLETEYSFWGNVEYSSNKEAMLARNKLAKDLKVQGYIVLGKSVLTGQTRKYAGLGQPDGTTGNVYKLRIRNKGV